MPDSKNKTLLFLLAIFILACSNKTKIIPEKKMVNILCDYYLVNSLVLDYTMAKKYEDLDSANIYGSILGQYNYSKEDFDSSLAYYIAQPDKIKKIYEQVVEELVKEETLLKENEKNKVEKKLVWEDDHMHRLPRDGATNKVEIDVPIKELGKYIITTEILLYSDDESKNPRTNLYFWYDNNSLYGNRQYFPPANLFKTDKTETYIVKTELRNSKFTHIKGFLIDDNNEEEDYKKHALIKKTTIEVETNEEN